MDFGGKKVYTKDKIRHLWGTRFDLNRFYYYIGRLELNSLIDPVSFVNESRMVLEASGPERILPVDIEIV